MLHPHTELRHIDAHVGYGVFATRPIPCGTITWALDPLDRVIELHELAAMPASLRRAVETWGYVNGGGDYVLCWDFARFMNHSCQPNVLSPGIEVEVAVRDIAAGDQLVSDYGAYNIEQDLTCLCRAQDCRGVIRPDDCERYAASWDQRLEHAARHIARVDQPLWPWVTSLQDVLATQSLPTALNNRYPQPAATVG